MTIVQAKYHRGVRPTFVIAVEDSQVEAHAFCVHTVTTQSDWPFSLFIHE